MPTILLIISAVVQNLQKKNFKVKKLFAVGNFGFQKAYLILRDRSVRKTATGRHGCFSRFSICWMRIGDAFIRLSNGESPQGASLPISYHSIVNGLCSTTIKSIVLSRIECSRSPSKSLRLLWTPTLGHQSLEIKAFEPQTVIKHRQYEL